MCTFSVYVFGNESTFKGTITSVCIFTMKYVSALLLNKRLHKPHKDVGSTLLTQILIKSHIIVMSATLHNSFHTEDIQPVANSSEVKQWKCHYRQTT